MYVVHRGVESIRKLLVFRAFFLPVAALALLWWAIAVGNGLGPILAQPSRFTSSAQFWAFFFPSLTGMVGYSGLLGAIGSIMIVDYYVLRRQQLSVPDLYRYHGRYAYRHGFNPAAIIALIIGILPNVPGFLTAIGVLEKGAVWPALVAVYNYAWFVGFGVSGAVYWGLMRGQATEQVAPPVTAIAAVAATPNPTSR